MFHIRQSYIWVTQYPVENGLVYENADCGVVLTGGKGRLRWALEILRKGRIQHLIISGANPETHL
ncbi:MAG: hypothetical protein NZ480_00565, partial [Bdellovibrionaceae bacterium]|nr:hypothetical protein [Pseudobdellovibrionaceae bacterium]MDW8190427.1 hypothetical protein [Pseudobdellovibrionaceae bacterium]